MQFERFGTTFSDFVFISIPFFFFLEAPISIVPFNILFLVLVGLILELKKKKKDSMLLSFSFGVILRFLKNASVFLLSQPRSKRCLSVLTMVLPTTEVTAVYLT